MLTYHRNDVRIGKSGVGRFKRSGHRFWPIIPIIMRAPDRHEPSEDRFDSIRAGERIIVIFRTPIDASVRYYQSSVALYDAAGAWQLRVQAGIRTKDAK